MGSRKISNCTNTPEPSFEFDLRTGKSNDSGILKLSSVVCSNGVFPVAYAGVGSFR